MDVLGGVLGASFVPSFIYTVQWPSTLDNIVCVCVWSLSCHASYPSIVWTLAILQCVFVWVGTFCRETAAWGWPPILQRNSRVCGNPAVGVPLAATLCYYLYHWCCVPLITASLQLCPCAILLYSHYQHQHLPVILLIYDLFTSSFSCTFFSPLSVVVLE